MGFDRAFVDLDGRWKGEHVRTAPGPIDREEAQPGPGIFAVRSPKKIGAIGVEVDPVYWFYSNPDPRGGGGKSWKKINRWYYNPPDIE